MNQLLRLMLVFLLSGSIAGCKQVTSTSDLNKPNVLLIVVDDQGYADFSPFENHDSQISTPNMERLADAGTVFTQAYTTAPVFARLPSGPGPASPW